MQISGKDRYIELADCTSIFGKPWWLDIICNGSWDAFVIEEKGNAILWPFFHKKKYGFQYIIMPQVSLFQGPFFRGTPTDDMFSEAINQFNKWDQVIYQCNPNWIPTDQYTSAFNSTKRTHYEIVSTENWRDNYNKNNQRKLKKAAKSLIISKANSPDNFFVLTQQTYKRQGVEVPYIQFDLNALFKAVTEKNCGYIAEARTEENEVAGTVWYIWDNESVYYFLSGMNDELANSGAITLLVDHGIELANQKCLKFNFYGSEVEGVARFMQAMGGIPKSSYLLESINNPILRVVTYLKNKIAP